MRRKFKQIYLLDGKELDQNIENKNCYGFLHRARKTPKWDSDCLDCGKDIEKGDLYVQWNRPFSPKKFHLDCLKESHRPDTIIGVQTKKAIRTGFGLKFIKSTDSRINYAHTVIICKKLSSIDSDTFRKDEK